METLWERGSGLGHGNRIMCGETEERGQEGQQNQWKYIASGGGYQGSLQEVPESWDQESSQNIMQVAIADISYCGSKEPKLVNSISQTESPVTVMWKPNHL